MSQLEDFIRKNRQALDLHEPQADGWQEIRKELPGGKRTISLRTPLAIAASIAILAGTFFFIGRSTSSGSDPVQAMIEPELLHMDEHYAVQIAQTQVEISTRQEVIEGLTRDYPAIESRFQEDLQRLNDTYATLRAQLPEHANQEILLKAMISNLQLQLDILNQQVSLIEKIKDKNYGKKQNI